MGRRERAKNGVNWINFGKIWVVWDFGGMFEEGEYT
jgi:hypothetical protein